LQFTQSKDKVAIFGRYTIEICKVGQYRIDIISKTFQPNVAYQKAYRWANVSWKFTPNMFE